jgi:phospholipid transport system substrate-binding protein
MVERRFFTFLWFAVLFLAAVPSRPLYADSPALEHLKTSIARLQQVLRDPKLAGAEHLYQRRKLARVVLRQIFDFEEMSRRSLGSNARTYSNRLEEFTPLFVDFLEHAYMGTLEENGDATIQYDKEIIDGKYVEIDTRTKLKNSKEYGVKYKVSQSPAGWRAYDVVIEGISLVNNYRAQFDRVLSKKSFDELLRDLRDKKDGLRE